MTACGTGSADRQPAGSPTSEAVAADPATTGSATTVRADGPHNDTDVMFLQMMVAHGKQGVELAQLAGARAQREEVRTLAAAVAATQTDEVSMMTSWLRGWSKPVAVDTDPAAHANHGGLPATGPEQIAALKKASKSEFDGRLLNLFIGHQHNAVEMATKEAADGANAETKEFARRVVESRTGQIQQMLTLLNE
ncbi:DUF305 domain-containing protein [Krasilnikovia cinnamomea]|uniref:DUF305 domain-containing protein n=1 Tax=Krasilnikovia cinnamomea TaxID=349313 RepID=UPI00102C9073|nr:DUF305 domain-containing protein [Krasilnikovia cinnamomea]